MKEVKLLKDLVNLLLFRLLSILVDSKRECSTVNTGIVPAGDMPLTSTDIQAQEVVTVEISPPVSFLVVPCTAVSLVVGMGV